MKSTLIFSFLIASVILISSRHAACEPSDSVQTAIDKTLAKARAAIDEYGVSDSAMLSIEAALAELAVTPGLKGRAEMTELHGSKAMAATLLASDGDTGICLYIARFGEDVATPVHDHLTWGVIHVLEGRDKHIHWESRDGSESDKIEIVMADERVLGPGESAYWLDPPHDIHSQQTLDGEVWELVVTGRNVLSDYVTENRHYYDRETGKVTTGAAR